MFRHIGGWRKRGSGRKRGAVSGLVVVAMAALLGLVALTVDVGTLYVAKQQLQNGADAGALAAVGRIRWGVDEDAARVQAQQIAANNNVLGESLVLDDGDVVYGRIDDATGEFTAGYTAYQELPVVQVTARRTQGSAGGPVPLAFARIFGIESVDVSATAIGALSSGQHARSAVEIVVAQDVSGSFRQELNDAKAADNCLVDIVHDAPIAGDSMAVVRFRGEVVRELGLSGGGIPGDTDTVHATIDAIQWGWELASGTHTGAGFAEALDIFEEQGCADSQQVIVLVSDGMCFGYGEWRWDEDTEDWVYYSEDHVTAERRQYAIDMADEAEARGIVIHTVTFVQDPPDNYEYGEVGDDAEFNAALCRNGGLAFNTPDPDELAGILKAVGNIEVGHPVLIQ